MKDFEMSIREALKPFHVTGITEFSIQVSDDFIVVRDPLDPDYFSGTIIAHLRDMAEVHVELIGEHRQLSIVCHKKNR